MTAPDLSAAEQAFLARPAVDAAEDARVDVVANWLCTEYGELLNGDADGLPGYWEFQARELLASLGEAAGETVTALQRVEAAWRHITAIAAANPGSKGKHYADAARILRAALGGQPK